MRFDGRGFLALLILVGISSAAFALPLTSSRPWRDSGVRVEFDRGFHYDGIVALSNCSASFVRFKGVSEDAPGLVLTNGHCVGGSSGSFLQPGEVFYQKPRNFSMRLLDRSGRRIASLESRKILYATMTDTDLALLELTQSYRQIKTAAGVTALELVDTAPAAGTEIEIDSGYWQKIFNCQIEDTVFELHEANWIFKRSLRYSSSGCEVFGGTSGSPILSVATGQVIAINNTGNEDGRACTLNNPCEISETGEIRVIRGRGYGQQIFGLSSCLTAQAQFDLSVATCTLPKPAR